jgi:hypothetical protein
MARKPRDILCEESQRNTTRRELLPCKDEVIDGEYERCGDAKMQEVRWKGESLESLALYGQGVEISWVEIVNHLEQQLIWEVEERHRLSLLLVGYSR